MLGEALGNAVLTSLEEGSEGMPPSEPASWGRRLSEWLDSQSDEEMRAPWRRSGSLWLTLLGSLLLDRDSV